MLRFVSLLILVLGFSGVSELSAQDYPALAKELNGTWMPFKKIGGVAVEHQYHWGVGLRFLGDEEIDLNGIPETLKGCQIFDDEFPYTVVSIVSVGARSLRVTAEVLGSYDRHYQLVTVYTILDNERMTMYRKDSTDPYYNGKAIWYRVSGPGEYLGKLVKISHPIVKPKQ